jgi:hypothetical protein
MPSKRATAPRNGSKRGRLKLFIVEELFTRMDDEL